MKKLNLNKVKLYCILNNVQGWPGIPSCWNCQKQTCSRTKSIRFHFDKTFRKFWIIEKEKGDHEYYDRIIIRVCDEWKLKS